MGLEPLDLQIMRIADMEQNRATKRVTKNKTKKYL